MGGSGWRPISDEEAPHLAALGALVRGLRDEFGLTQRALGRLANVSVDQVGAIERGQRRTRESTLSRLVGAVVLDEDRAALLVAEMVEATGPALALEEDEAQKQRMLKRLERRDRRWAVKYLRESVQIATETTRSLRRMVEGHERSGRTGPLVDNTRSLLEKMTVDLERMRAKVLEAEQDAARRDRASPLPRRPDKGPAWHELQEYARSLLPPGRTSGRIYPTSEQEARLAELKTAADAEEAEADV